MNVSSASGGLSLVMEDVKPVRSGSLPFKKRRFPRLALIVLSNESNEVEDQNSTLVACPDSTENCDVVAAPDAERIAALALVAAAASQKDASTSSETIPEDSVVVSGAAKSEPTKHGFSFCYQQASTMASTDSPTLNSALVAAAADLQSLHDATDFDAITCKKISRAPLTSPLPNGCHGRTSRNNSYCRRQPYNGSHFCKSHYQSLVVSGAATEEELKNGKIIEIGEVPPESIPGVSSSPDGTRAAGTLHHAVHQQDKRYTGAANEIRCKATTTRGRDCSYCSVNGTKYCHLHATFDTNPPPRRGGASYANAAKAREAAGGPPEAAAKSLQTFGNSKPGKAGKTDGPAKRRGSSMSARRLSTTKNLEKHMAHAPYPLLSTLATDKWLKRKVIVSTGPLTNHVGHVEKWGNGWISVRLPGVGLHNRRSFELYLHPNPDSEGDSSNPGSAENAESRVEVFDASEEGKKTIKSKFVRVPSIDEGTPPTPLLSDRPIMGEDTVHEVTPLTSCRVIGIDQSLPKGVGGAGKVSNIMFPTCFGSSVPATVPESPVPQPTGVDIEGSSTDDIKRPVNLSVKPPVEADSNDIPLVQSLMLAQGGRSAKNKLGLLFGTAALERSRRNIHKPQRYEDTELIAKKLKKRDRDSDLEGASKRHCASSSNGSERSSTTPVISSSSDEESANVPRSIVSN